jgi:alpha-L-rhamnosidase
VLAGINPDEEFPGFKKIRIKPNVVGDLSWVKARYQSQYGEISSSWKVENDSLYMEITIPVNTSALVYIPCGDIQQVSESGKPVLGSEDVKSGLSENGKTILSLGSGEYHFSMPFIKKISEKDYD